MKLIPIATASERINTSDRTVIEVLTPPNKTNYTDIFARITFETIDSFADTSKIVRTRFNSDFDLTTGRGVPYGNLDVVELENIEQITAFSFTTAENTKEATAWVEYFNKIEN